MTPGYESAVRFSPKIKNSENFSPGFGRVITRAAEMTTITMAKKAAKNRIRSLFDPFREIHSFCKVCRISGTGSVYRNSGEILVSADSRNDNEYNYDDSKGDDEGVQSYSPWCKVQTQAY